MAKARDAGCTPEELEHAILLLAPTAGFPRMVEALERLREFLESPAPPPRHGAESREIPGPGGAFTGPGQMEGFPPGPMGPGP